MCSSDLGNIDSAACQEERLLCIGKCFDRTFQLSDVDTGVWLVAADIYALWIFCTAQFSHYILGQVNENRSRASGTCNIEGFLDDTSKIFTVAYSDSILGNTAGNSYNINFLECIVSNQMTCYLTGEAHQRNAVVIVIRNVLLLSMLMQRKIVPRHFRFRSVLRKTDIMLFPMEKFSII